jgi:hypothetical protein
VCYNCATTLSRFSLITYTRAKKEYKLKDTDLYALQYMERRNPYYSCAAPMKLYLKSDVYKVALMKYNLKQI